MATRITYGPGVPVTPSRPPLVFDGHISFERLPNGRIHGRFYRDPHRSLMEAFFSESDVEAWTIWAAWSFLPNFWTEVQEALK